MAEFRMPSLGADMEEGTLVEWLKHPGDAVKRGDIIAVVDTDKGAIEIEVFEDGTVERLCIAPGDKVPVGTVLATIHPAGAAPRAGGAPSPAGAQPSPARARLPLAASLAGASAIAATGPSQPKASGRVTEGAPTAGRFRASPLARKLATDLGVDLMDIEGTGPQGAVTREDVERAAAARKTSTAGPSPPPRARDMRAAIAAAMTRSKREIPHYYLSSTIDLGKALAWLRDENTRRPVTERLLPVALLLKAVARALREVPRLNGHWIDGGFRPGSGVHIGCAISLRGGGLVAPALHDADQLELSRLMSRLADLIARARAGTLRSSELADPTITVTNLGDQGAEAAFGIIYPPQVALVGFGRIVERPWADRGQVAVRPVVTTSLSADHRATDGHQGGSFLAAVDRWLQTPETL